MSVKMNTIYLIRLLSQPNLLRRPPIYYAAAAAAAAARRANGEPNTAAS
jgi:transcription initiation factor TFIIIB Brf1 subunit/transcription initiation factor TFIIB